MSMYDFSNAQEFISRFWDSIRTSNRILITSHKNPDDDSFSSVLSMYRIITDQYPEKTIEIAYSGDFRNRWKSFPKAELVKSVDDITDSLNEFDTLLVLDVTKFERFSDKPELVKAYTGKKICIDHHSSEHDQYDFLFVQAGATSTAELLYRLFCEKNDALDPQLAESLLLGVIGDTSWFTVNMAPDHSYILSIADRLMAEGQVNLELFKSRIRGYSQQVFMVMQELVKNAKFMDINGWPRFMYSTIARDFAQNNTVSENDIKEGCDIFVATFTKTLNDVPWGMLFYPGSEGEVKVSLRSRPGSVNVRKFAEELGLGGGHNGASGMKIVEPGKVLEPSESMHVLFDWMQNNPAPVYEQE